MELYTETFPEKHLLRILTTASVSSVIANVLIAVTVIKYKNLRNDITHSILLHVSLLQIFSIIFTECLPFLDKFQESDFDYTMGYCAAFTGIGLLNSGSFLLIVVLLFHWYATTFWGFGTYLHKRYYLFFIVIYSICLTMFPILTKRCFHIDMLYSYHPEMISYVIAIGMSIFMNIVDKCSESTNKTSSVILGFTGLILWFSTPCYALLIFTKTVDIYVPLILVQIADILAIGLFPFELLYLYIYDKNFQMYFRKLFTCSNLKKAESMPLSLIENTALV